MKWSWKLARLAGIDVYVHVTFFLLMAWVMVAYWLSFRSIATVAEGAIFLLALFGSVLLHEFGHALAARKFGVGTLHITLLPVGGIAALERIPEEPRKEFWIAIAGPAVNFAIAGVLFGWLALGGALEPLRSLGLAAGPFVERLAFANLILAAFNLLPAFPLDGGRILRALLAARIPHVKATVYSAWAGQGFAVLLGFYGLFANPFALLIAAFIWMAAGQEAAAVKTKHSLEGVDVGRAMLTDYVSLDSSDGLSRAVDLILTTSQQDFPVVEQGRMVGLLTRADVVSALTLKGQDVTVAEVMKREFATAHPMERLDVLFTRLRGALYQPVAVVSGGRLVGILTMENLSEYLMIREALSTARA